ncbi:hypothetical protein SAMN02910456_02661 [Ruminococcaceae bacterium YRB3002]|nr:hypothetical protein SAMN02910456_02661 [Ruminococcaceae bacterium YRB3002]
MSIRTRRASAALASGLTAGAKRRGLKRASSREPTRTCSKHHIPEARMRVLRHKFRNRRSQSPPKRERVFCATSSATGEASHPRSENAQFVLRVPQALAPRTCPKHHKFVLPSPLYFQITPQERKLRRFRIQMSDQRQHIFRVDGTVDIQIEHEFEVPSGDGTRFDLRKVQPER